MGIGHRGADILVPDKFPNGPDAVTTLQQMSRKRTPRCITSSLSG
jgi:hypothetical protein